MTFINTYLCGESKNSDKRLYEYDAHFPERVPLEQRDNLRDKVTIYKVGPRTELHERKWPLWGTLYKVLGWGSPYLKVPELLLNFFRSC